MRPRVKAAVIGLFFLWVAAPAAQAQTVGAALGTCLALSPAGACPAFSVRVFAEDVRLAGNTVGVSLGPDHLKLTSWSAQTFGPLGNVVFELEGELRSGPFARARVAARGVIASVAARAALVAAGADEERFDSLAVARDGRPLVGGPTLGLELGGTFRLDRQVVLDVAPDVYVAPGGLTVDALATLRLLRAVGPNELQLHLQSAVLPVGRGGHVALGTSVVLPRGRAPDWTFSVWAGWGPTGVLPGASLAMAEDLAPGVRLTADAAYQPYRRDARPLRVSLGLTARLGEPTLRLEVAGGALHPSASDAVAAELSIGFPLPERFR